MKILAIGAHPDDIEIGIFGTLARHHELGDEILLCDLTQGEMGSNGTIKERQEEAQAAAQLINAKRVCLQLPDRGISVNREQIEKVVRLIREEKPDYILYPYHIDYHPDHEATAQLVREAIHSSGLKQFYTGGQQPHRPSRSAQYFINDIGTYNLLIDISEVMDLKIEALMCHKSQFLRSEGSTATYLNNGFIEKVKTRNAYLGSVLSHCNFAEALYLKEIPLVDSLLGNLK